MSGTGGDDDVFGFERARAARIELHRDLARGFDFGRAENALNFVFLEQIINALHIAINARLLISLHGRHIDFGLTKLNAHIGGMARLGKKFGGMEQGF